MEYRLNIHVYTVIPPSPFLELLTGLHFSSVKEVSLSSGRHSRASKYMYWQTGWNFPEQAYKQQMIKASSTSSNTHVERNLRCLYLCEENTIENHILKILLQKCLFLHLFFNKSQNFRSMNMFIKMTNYSYWNISKICYCIQDIHFPFSCNVKSLDP